MCLKKSSINPLYATQLSCIKLLNGIKWVNETFFQAHLSYENKISFTMKS